MDVFPAGSKYLIKVEGSLTTYVYIPELMAKISCLLPTTKVTPGNQRVKVWMVPLNDTFNGPYSKCLQLDPMLSIPLVHGFNIYGWGEHF